MGGRVSPVEVDDSATRSTQSENLASPITLRTPNMLSPEVIFFSKKQEPQKSLTPAGDVGVERDEDLVGCRPPFPPQENYGSFST